MNEIPFYVVHYSKNIDRKKRLELEFGQYNISNIRWITEYDKETLGVKKEMCTGNLSDSLISVTVKHWFALKTMIENDNPFAVVMEDNVSFKADIKNLVDEYLKEAPGGWDIIYEGDTHYARYKEGRVYKHKKLYKKSNRAIDNKEFGGASRCSNFYIINLESAKKMIKELETFDNVHDHYCNTIFRKLNFNVYWVEPPMVHRIMTHKRLAEVD